MNTLHLKIEGMHCGACVNRVNNALSNLAGIEVEKVDIGAAEVHYDESSISPDAIVSAVTKAGYPAQKTS
jgi:copper chaperone